MSSIVTAHPTSRLFIRVIRADFVTGADTRLIRSRKKTIYVIHSHCCCTAIVSYAFAIRISNRDSTPTNVRMDRLVWCGLACHFSTSCLHARTDHTAYTIKPHSSLYHIWFRVVVIASNFALRPNSVRVRYCTVAANAYVVLSVVDRIAVTN